MATFNSYVSHYQRVAGVVSTIQTTMNTIPMVHGPGGETEHLPTSRVCLKIGYTPNEIAI